MADGKDIISLSDVAFSYLSDDGEGKETASKAVDGVTLKIERGFSIISLVGDDMKNQSGVTGRMFDALGGEGIVEALQYP